jgi:hypothetical protein
MARHSLLRGGATDRPVWRHPDRHCLGASLDSAMVWCLDAREIAVSAAKDVSSSNAGRADGSIVDAAPSLSPAPKAAPESEMEDKTRRSEEPRSPENPDRYQVMRDTIMPAMEGISECLFMRGFTSVIVVHQLYRIVEWLSRYGSRSFEDITLIPIRGLRWLKVRVEAANGPFLMSLPFWHLPKRDAKRVPIDLGFSGEANRVPALGIILAGGFFSIGALIAAPIYAVLAIARALSTTFMMAIREIPYLLAILLVVFTSSDAWRLYGSEAYSRFIVLIVIMVGLGIAAVFRIVADEADEIAKRAADVAAEKVDWRTIIFEPINEGTQATSLAKETPAKVLADHHVRPLNIIGENWARWLMTNAKAIFWFTIIMQIVAIAFWVSVSFMVLGMVVANSEAYSQLLPAHTQPTVIWHSGVLGQTFIVSQQLVLLSVTLGTIAGLTFATVSLQDDGSRQRFLNHSLSDLKCSLVILSYYLGAFQELILLLQLDRSRIVELLRGDIGVLAPSRAEGDSASQQSSEQKHPG